MPITITPAKGSSQIRSITYDPDKQTVAVFFNTSSTPYIHSHVPAAVFDAWKEWHEAGYSPGKFYHSHIKHFPLLSV